MIITFTSGNITATALQLGAVDRTHLDLAVEYCARSTSGDAGHLLWISASFSPADLAAVDEVNGHGRVRVDALQLG